MRKIIACLPERSLPIPENMLRLGIEPNTVAMRTPFYLTLSLVLTMLMAACQKEKTEVALLPYGIESHYPFSGQVGGQEFGFFLRQTQLQTMVGHTGYYYVWSSDYELNTTTEADGNFHLKFQFPLSADVYEAFQPGYLGEGFDNYYWNLCLIVPQHGGPTLAHYGAYIEVVPPAPLVLRSEEAASGVQIIERSPIMLDHQGEPYFEVRLRFDLAVSRTDIVTEAAYLLKAEGLFRVPLRSAL